MKSHRDIKLSILPGSLAICQLGKEIEIPSWTHGASFVSISRTPDELSIVCDQPLVPAGVKKVENWRAFKVEGPLDFSLTGIVASISQVLAVQKVPVFIVSTYDTDYILVQKGDYPQAIEVLGTAFTLVQEEQGRT